MQNQRWANMAIIFSGFFLLPAIYIELTNIKHLLQSSIRNKIAENSDNNNL
jgi:hypothetical protein